MKRSFLSISCLIVSFYFLCTSLKAQEMETVQWISFEALEDSLAVKPKKVFIDFYTDWCTYCRIMDKSVVTKPQVVETLNDGYYAVRFNAESEYTVNFGGQAFINDQIGKSRTPLHQIAQLLALRKGNFVAPTMIVLDKEFKVISRHFTYLDSKKLLKALN